MRVRTPICKSPHQVLNTPSCPPDPVKSRSIMALQEIEIELGGKVEKFPPVKRLGILRKHTVCRVMGILFSSLIKQIDQAS